MGDTATGDQGSYDIFYNVDPDVYIVYKVLYSDAVEEEIFDPNVDYIPTETRTKKQPSWSALRQSFSVVADVTASSRDSKWSLQTTCVK